MMFPCWLQRFSHGTRTATRIRAGLHGRSERSFGAATDVAERHGAGVPFRETPGELGFDHPLFLRDPRYPIRNLVDYPIVPIGKTMNQ